MCLPLVQSISYLDSRRPWVPSDHNTRWRLLNIYHNFFIKSKTLSNKQHLTREARQKPLPSPDDVVSARTPRHPPCQILFVRSIIVIDPLNKIWNSFQISFHLMQWFNNQYYLRTCETFFPIHLGWWILSWSLKYICIVYDMFNVFPFVTFTKISFNKIKT